MAAPGKVGLKPEATGASKATVFTTTKIVDCTYRSGVEPEKGIIHRNADVFLIVLRDKKWNPIPNPWQEPDWMLLQSTFDPIVKKNKYEYSLQHTLVYSLSLNNNGQKGTRISEVDEGLTRLNQDKEVKCVPAREPPKDALVTCEIVSTSTVKNPIELQDVIYKIVIKPAPKPSIAGADKGLGDSKETPKFTEDEWKYLRYRIETAVQMKGQKMGGSLNPDLSQYKTVAMGYGKEMKKKHDELTEAYESERKQPWQWTADENIFISEDGLERLEMELEEIFSEKIKCENSAEEPKSPSAA